ncbi:uncharacterized protein l1td1 [Odontesthes bonariensis]
MPKKDEGKKMTSQASPSAANTDAILAATASHGVELVKICTLVDDLKKSMEGRLDSIEACPSTLQKEHREAEHRPDDMDEALSTTDSRIAALEATCRDLSTANGLLKAKGNDLQGRSRRLNVRIVGIKEGEENGRPTEFVSRLIPELLGRDNFTKPVKIDRAHRSRTWSVSSDSAANKPRYSTKVRGSTYSPTTRLSYHSGVQTGRLQRWDLPGVGQLPLSGWCTLRRRQHPPLHLPAHRLLFLPVVWKSWRRHAADGEGFRLGYNATVTVGGDECESVDAGDTELRCRTPAGAAGSQSVTVTVGSTSQTASSSFTYNDNLTAQISSLSPRSTTVMGETHSVSGASFSYTQAADVGLLTRNIKIIGEEYPAMMSESFGARLLVGAFSSSGIDFLHITPVLSSLHGLPVLYRTDFKLLMFVFKALNGLAPLYLSELLTVLVEL